MFGTGGVGEQVEGETWAHNFKVALEKHGLKVPGPQWYGDIERFVAELAGEAVLKERKAWEDAVRKVADELWQEGKTLEDADPGRSKLLKVICTNLHRLCQIVKGEEPLPAPGSRLTK